jgi:hypothetical protein
MTPMSSRKSSCQRKMMSRLPTTSMMTGIRGIWFPEDATMEVWSENIEKHTWMIESCLRENHIHARTDKFADGSRKVFVMPADDRRAREIVREVEDARPLK